MNDLAELLARTGLGEQRAFEQLYAVASPKVYGFLCLMLKDDDMANDVLQETFVQVWKNAGTYKAGLSKPMTWITALARYRALDALRKVKRSDGDPEELQLLVDHASPDAHDEVSIRRCMDELSEDQQKSISLAYFAGYTHSELSERLDTPLGTVKSWIRRGLDSLKVCLSR